MDNPFSFTDEKTGYRLDTEPLFDGIVQAAEKLQPFKAEVTPTVLEPELYRAELENATGMRARVRLLLDSGDALENERLALSGLNGRMIAPGESLSFNSAIGNRVEEAGYVSASEPAFGPYAEGVGGGVCRIATMLYQTALLSGLSVAEDEKNQFGWQGTLTFTQYKTTAKVKKTNDNSSAAAHTGSTGQVQSVEGDALKQMLQRAGVN